MWCGSLGFAFKRVAGWNRLLTQLNIFLWNNPFVLKSGLLIGCVLQRSSNFFVHSEVWDKVILRVLVHILLKFVWSSCLGFALVRVAGWD